MKPSVPHGFVRHEAAAFAGLAREVEESLSSWTDRYPLFDRARVPALALTTATHLPDLSPADRDLAAALKLWICAFDDVVDEQRVTRAELDELLVQCMRILNRERPQDHSLHQLSTALLEIVSILDGYVMFDSLKSLIQARFAAFVRGVVLQRDWGAARSEAGRFEVPSYEEHMAIARDSSGVPFYLAVCFVLYNDAQLFERLNYLIRVGDACATALRLANDLRTWGKEDREGTFNTLAALEWEVQRASPDLTAPAYRKRALGLIAERLESAISEVQKLLVHSPVASGSVEAGIERFTHFVTGFYARYDFHEYKAE